VRLFVSLLIVSCLFVPAKRAYADNENRFAGAGVSELPPEIPWSNPGNITADDNADASTLNFDSDEVNYHLRSHSYGFTIPAGATIDGIEVQVEKLNSGGTASDNESRLAKAGAMVGADRSVGGIWPTARTVVTYGSPTDLWGTTWTPAEINAAGFGFSIQAAATNVSNVFVDYHRIIVYYTNTTTIGDGTSPANNSVAQSSTNNAVDAFTLATDSGTDTVTALTVTFTGTDVNDVAASGVKIYEDNGGTPNEWDGTDTLIDTASFSGSTASFTGLNISVNTTPTQYLVTYDIAAGATASNTLQGAITAATVTNTLVNNDTTDATLTVSTGTFYFEAENYTTTGSLDGGTHSYVSATTEAGYYGSGYMWTGAPTGENCAETPPSTPPNDLRRLFDLRLHRNYRWHLLRPPPPQSGRWQ